MYARAHVATALQLVQQYNGDLPFVHQLKQYFSLHKKHGSRDRKQIAQLCYCWFRLGHALKHLPAAERMMAALFLCSDQPNPLLAGLHEDWNQHAAAGLEEKLRLIDAGLSMEEFGKQLFPLFELLSTGIEPTAFACSHLQQPDLFIRIRPAYIDIVKRKLTKAGIPFTMEAADACRLPNGLKIEELFKLNQELVVQDLNSQRAGNTVTLVADELKQRDDLHIWDACAASGGKSMLVFDRLPGATLTVTDIRSSILQNLYQRFRQAGLYSYNGFVADLSDPLKAGPDYDALPKQDLIIADLPCSGSGTWSRTPEQLATADPAIISHYSDLQRKILPSLLPKLAEGGYLLYITCSVFAAENEENINWLKSRYPFRVVHQELLNGYTQKADSMFVALLQML